MSSTNALAFESSTSDKELVSSFQCPESFPDRSTLDSNYSQFSRSILARHPSWTVEEYSMFRYALLELHECAKTLENIRQNLQVQESEGMYVANQQLPVTSYTAGCFRPGTRNLKETAELSNTQNLRDEASTDKNKLSDLIDMATKGSSAAEFYLATLYDPSLNFTAGTITKDWAVANKWYRKAANNGLPEAAYSLGNSYANGNGLVKSDSEAIYWYEVAAKHGYVAAEWNVAVAYETGEGVKLNNIEAQKWYCAAALAGDQQSQWHMVHIYFDKEMTQKFDYTFYWLDVLQKEGDEGAKMLLDDLGSAV